MAQIIYAARALTDLERLTDFLLLEHPVEALKTVELIGEAVQILRHHPLVGRPVENDMRELVISRGKSGYVALYQVDEVRDLVLILALRHQREVGFG